MACSKGGPKELGGWGWRDRKKQGLVSLRPKVAIKGRFKKEHKKLNRKGPLKLSYPVSRTKAPVTGLPARMRSQKCGQAGVAFCMYHSNTQVFPSENLSLLLELNLDS